MQYFIHHNDQQIGPFTEAEVKAKLASGEITPQDHVWWEGQQGWTPLGQTPLAGTATPAVPVTPVAPVGAVAPVREGTTSSLALWSLICGCVGLLCGFASIPAIILGHMGLSETKKNPALKGRGMALAGTILGYVVVALIAAYMIFVFAIVGSNFSAIKAQIQSAQAEAATNTAPATTPDSSTNSASTNAAPATQ